MWQTADLHHIDLALCRPKSTLDTFAAPKSAPNVGMGVFYEFRVRFWMFMVRQRQYKGGNVVGRAKLLILQKYVNRIC